MHSTSCIGGYDIHSGYLENVTVVCQNGSWWPFLEQAAQGHTGGSVLFKKKLLKGPRRNLAGQTPGEPHLILKDLFIDIGKTEQIMFRSPTFCRRTL